MRKLAFAVVLLCGCSTRPIADIMDTFAPARTDVPEGPRHGGVMQIPASEAPAHTPNLPVPPPSPLDGPPPLPNRDK